MNNSIIYAMQCNAMHNDILSCLIILINKMELVDYRNGKYQGPLTPGTSLRHGLGILIDDDLSMYASHWQYNKLHGSTLIYLKHGQYVYGEWKDN